MEIKLNAVTLRAADYGENDKILTLLTAENGKITAGIKGVKKPNAKLKFAAQPFCFAEFVLVKKGDKLTVTNCSELESFYDLRTDINKFYAACAALEGAAAVTYEGGECGEIFYALVKTLSQISAGDERAPLIAFLNFLLTQAGYAISAESCSECGRDLTAAEKLRFDMDTGAVTYNVLRKVAGKSFDSGFITADGEKRALRLIREYFAYKTDCPLKSLGEYVRLI